MLSKMKTPVTSAWRSNLHLILFGIFALASANLRAQGPTSAYGTVVDAATNEPLAFATVQFEGKTVGATTGIDGRFQVKIDEPVSTLKVTYMGYETRLVELNPGAPNPDLEIRMGEASNTLKEVVIRNEKYRNKDNPAVELIRQVIEHKEQNRREGLDYFSLEQYEKVEFALNHIDDKLRNNLIFRNMQFLFDNADTSANGAVNLPFYLYERLSDLYYRKEPREEKTVVKGEQSTSLPGIIDGKGIASYVENLYQQVDIYDNRISLATTEFVSPLAPAAPAIYRFYLQDTSQLDEARVVRLYFAPRNKGDLAFEGNMWIALDGSYAVRKIELGVPRHINLNWVSELRVEQEFDWVQSDNDALGATRRLMLSQDVVTMDFSARRDTNARAIIGRKTTSYRNYTLNQPLPDQLFKFSGLTQYAENANQQTASFWEKSRHISLSKREKGIQETVDTLKNYRPFKRFVSVARIFVEGYHSINDGGFEVGPVNTFYSFNPVEGFRARLGGRTNMKFARDLQLEGYLAYGTKDERWKSYVGATYAFGNQQIKRFPLDQVKVWYQDEVKIPGQELQFVQEDNFFLSFKRGVNDKMIYNRVFGVEYLKELASHFSYAFTAKTTRQMPAGALRFEYGSPEHPSFDPELQTAEFGVHLRFAPNERFYQGGNYRTPILNRHPVFNLWYNLGVRGILGSEYQYHSLQAKVEKLFYVAPMGRTTVVLEGGRIFGTLPYPLLKAHRANQSFAYQLESYNLMNFMEFISDKYASVNVTQNFWGFFFNRIPLLNRLKLREMVSFKGLWGGLDNANRPTEDNGLLLFPTNPDGTPLSYALGNKPYMEASVGVSNIFKILRVDYVRRLSYLDHPNVAKWGIRVRFKVEF